MTRWLRYLLERDCCSINDSIITISQSIYCRRKLYFRFRIRRQSQFPLRRRRLVRGRRSSYFKRNINSARLNLLLVTTPGRGSDFRYSSPVSTFTLCQLSSNIFSSVAATRSASGRRSENADRVFLGFAWMSWRHLRRSASVPRRFRPRRGRHPGAVGIPSSRSRETEEAGIRFSSTFARRSSLHEVNTSSCS